MCKCTLCTRFEEACFVTSSLSRKPRDGIRDFFFNQESKLDTKERYWGQQFCQFGPTRPVKVDHLQSWSPIFRSDQLNIHSVSFDQWNVRNVGLKGILIQAWVTCGDGDAEMLVQSVGSEWPFKITRYIFINFSQRKQNHTGARHADNYLFFFNGHVYKFPLSPPLSLYFSHSEVCLFFFIPMSIKRKRSAWKNENMVARCFFMSLSA